MALPDARLHRLPGDVVLRPTFLVSATTLLVNDHLLKRWAPGPVTGKLSDVAAMVCVPLLLAATWELASAVRGRRSDVAPRGRSWALCLAVGLVFVLMKTVPQVGDLYGDVLGLVRGALGGDWDPVRVAHDPTDAFAAVFTLVPLLELLRRSSCRLTRTR